MKHADARYPDEIESDRARTQLPTAKETPSSGSERRLVRWRLSRDADGDFQWDLLRTDGTSAATVWDNGTWHTWDQKGTGGENSSQDTVCNAQMEALLSAINQGFLPANRLL